MSILENTISMMEVLPEADLLEIQNFTKKLFRLRNVNSCFQPVSEEKILDDLATSRKQIAEGKSKEMGQAIEGYGRSMDYKVIISELAEAQLDHIVFYILSELSNEQAAISVLNDAEETKLRLTHVAGSLKLSDHPRLRELGYRIIHFKRHQYIMAYKIQGKEVHVEGIYHCSQDYQNVLR